MKNKVIIVIVAFMTLLSMSFAAPVFAVTNASTLCTEHHVTKLGKDNEGQRYCDSITAREPSKITPALFDGGQKQCGSVVMEIKIIYYKKVIDKKYDAYKVTEVKGRYVKTSKSKKPCSSLRMKNKATGLRYDSNGKSHKMRSFSNQSATHQYPKKGKWYSFKTGQKYYYDTSVSGSYNATRWYVKVKGSSKEYVLDDDFGEVTLPF